MDKLLLGVNIDHVATIRNVRNTTFPDPIQAAFISEQAGADSITIHLREDRRHITDRDIGLLSHTIQTRINLEMAVTNESIDIACKMKPYSVCLVPENRQELTTEGGLDVLGQIDKIKLAVQKLNNVGIVVSLFINADYRQIESAIIAGAKYIEIHTGEYANAPKGEIRDTEFIRIREAAKFAANLSLKVNAGHGLTYHNVQPIASISELCELNIGHSIISRALFSGMKDAVKDMKQLIQSVQRY